MSIDKDEFQYQPAARRIWTTLRRNHKDTLAKNRAQAEASLRRLLMGMTTEGKDYIDEGVVHDCPLREYIENQLSLTFTTQTDQETIHDTWKWLIGING